MTSLVERTAVAFIAVALPKSEWTHHAHLAVGTWQVNADGPEQALATLRTGIRQLNDAHGTANSDSGGYHETITRAYVVLIAEFLGRAEASDGKLAAHVQALLASPLASRAALLAFYSKSRLFSVEARRDWVEPDEAPLSLDTLFVVTSPSSTG